VAFPETPSRSWGDYRPAGGSGHLRAGETTAVIPLQINGDTTWEAEASFTVLLSTKGAAFVMTDAFTVTLKNDDAPAA
jgi:hypothetical protein